MAASTSDRPPLWVVLLAGAPVLLLYVVVGWQSYGFDDEILTLDAIARAGSAADLVRYLAISDVHPPGSYLVVWSLDHLGWAPHHMRAMAGMLTAIGLVALWAHVAPREPVAAGFAFLVICLCPTLLLWGATLRWYSWSLPLLAGMLIILLRNPLPRWRFWGGLAASAVALAYLGYANLLVLPGLLLAALWRRRERFRHDLPAIIAGAVVFLVLVLPQLVLVLPGQVDKAMTVHGQGTLRRVAGLGFHVLGGQASMPFGASALLLTLANLLLLAGALAGRGMRLGSIGAMVLVPGLASFLAAGLTGHFRTLTVLSPAQAVWQGGLFGGIVSARFRLTVLVLFAAGTFAGLWNVIRHEDTTKTGWNRPYGEALSIIAEADAVCASLSVLTFDPVLAWHLRQIGQRQLILGSRDTAEAIATEPGCLMLVDTHSARFPETLVADLARGRATRGAPVQDWRLGHDRHAAFKRRFDPRTPDHTMIVWLHGPLAP